MTETHRIEFKRELTDELDLEKEVVAFLNYKEGGIIYIGIDKTGIPVGVDDLDGTMLKIKDRIRNNVAPSPLGLQSQEQRADASLPRRGDGGSIRLRHAPCTTKIRQGMFCFHAQLHPYCDTVRERS